MQKLKSAIQLDKILLSPLSIRKYSIKNADVNSYNAEFRYSGKIGELFKELDSVGNHCIYWFECEDHHEGVIFKKSLEIFRIEGNKDKRTIPVANTNEKSNVLYVGKRYGGRTKRQKHSHIAGRIFIHLGYYHKITTQGLQLKHWYKNDLSLTIVQFPEEAKPYLGIIERLYALELLPLCGSHR